MDESAAQQMVVLASQWGLAAESAAIVASTSSVVSHDAELVDLDEFMAACYMVVRTPPRTQCSLHFSIEPAQPPL